MTKFENPSFSVFPGANKNYRDNYDSVFGKKDTKADELMKKQMSDLAPARDAQVAPLVPVVPKSKKRVRTKKITPSDAARTEDRCGPDEDGEYGVAPLERKNEKKSRKPKAKK